MDSTKVPPDVGEDETITVQIVPHIPEDSRLIFADNVAVQHTPTEFTITFAQVRQPLVQKSSEYEGMTTIRADVVARIVITPAKMVEFIKAVQENWGMYQRRMKAFVEAKGNVSPANTTDNTASTD